MKKFLLLPVAFFLVGQANAALEASYNGSVKSSPYIVSQALLGRMPTPDEVAAVGAIIGRIHSARLDAGNQFAESGKTTSIGSGARQRSVFICVGFKMAIVALGAQALRCSSLSGELIRIGFSDESFMDENTGFQAKNYIGVNAGLALDLGVALFTHPLGTDVRGDYDRRSENSFSGGTFNMTYLLYGAMLGYFEQDNQSLVIIAWQPGIVAFEASLSRVRIR